MHARRPNQVERLLPVRLAEPVEEQILALQRAADRHAKRTAHRRRQADQQRVRQVDDVEGALGGQPVEHLADLLALEALLPPQHRHRQLAKALGIDLDLALRRHADDPVGIPEPIEQSWRVAEDRRRAARGTR